jgi:mannosyltransferase
MNLTRRNLIAFLAVLLLATFLRFHLIEAQSFWNDEGNSARLSERSISAILEGTASDIHPPFYYLFLRGWRELVGETEFGLRSLSAFSGILTVATAIALTRSFSARRFSDGMFVAGLLAATSPILVYYSQETRMYALLAFLGAFSTWALWIWLIRLEARRPSLLWMVVYVLTTVAGLYTHYFFPAVIGGQGLVVVTILLLRLGKVENRTSEHYQTEKRFAGRVLITWFGMVAVTSILYVPWIPIFLRQVGGRSGEVSGLLNFLADIGRWLSVGTTMKQGEGLWAIAAALILVVMGIVAGGRRAIAPLTMVVVPLALMVVVGATDPAYFKFLLVVVPFLCVLAGFAWFWKGWKRSLPIVMMAVLLFGHFISLSNMYTDPDFARADYRGMAKRIAAEAHPNAGIILNAPNQWEAFTYYHRDGAPVYPLPRNRPEPDLIEPELERMVAEHDRLYVLFWGENQRDPDHVIERWLDAHTFKAQEEWVGDVRFAVYSIPAERDIELQPANVRFLTPGGENIDLLEYAAWPEVTSPGDIVQVQLVWQADSNIPRAYKVFLHLIDSSGNLVAQRDSEPAGGSRPTTSWEAGEKINDNYGLLLPGDLVPGMYIVRVGFYDAQDPAARLSWASNGQEGDSFDLATIRVR